VSTESRYEQRIEELLTTVLKAERLRQQQPGRRLCSCARSQARPWAMWVEPLRAPRILNSNRLSRDSGAVHCLGLDGNTRRRIRHRPLAPPPRVSCPPGKVRTQNLEAFESSVAQVYQRFGGGSIFFHGCAHSGSPVSTEQFSLSQRSRLHPSARYNNQSTWQNLSQIG
jgi:hypothetical protein